MQTKCVYYYVYSIRVHSNISKTSAKVDDQNRADYGKRITIIIIIIIIISK